MFRWFVGVILLISLSPLRGEERALCCSTEYFVDSFFRHLFTTTTCGYVLFGNKPVAVENYLHPEQEIPGTPEHYLATQIVLFRELLPVSKKEKNHIVHFGNHELLFINRKSFYRAIEDNLLLFQAKFGIGITAKSLLDNLLENNFRALFQEAIALQGIILGYGTTNSLTYEKGSLVKKSLFADRGVTLPYRLPAYPKTEEELVKELEKAIFWKEISSEVKNLSHYKNSVDDSLKIPFSFHKKTSETNQLFNEYKKSQNRIDSLLKSKNISKEVLHLLGINLPPSSTITITKEEEQALPRIVARSILDSFQEEFSPAFIEGMRAAQLGAPAKEPEEVKFFEILRRNYSNLLATKALETFENKETQCLIPKRLYIHTVKEGASPKQFSFKNKTITINLLVEQLDGTILSGNYTMAKPLQISTEALLPAIAFGMVEMKIGEIRELYIHPQLLYGSRETAALKITIELLDLGEIANTETPIFLQPSDVSHLSPPISSYISYSNLQNTYFYHCGFKTWSHYAPLLSLETLLLEIHKSPPPLSSRDQLTLLKLNWFLYQKKNI